PLCYLFFFFYDTATSVFYTLSLHDALPIFRSGFQTEARLCFFRAQTVSMLHGYEKRLRCQRLLPPARATRPPQLSSAFALGASRSEEHTSELQSLAYLVCRLLLEKKKKYQY